jgi:hypothetical protein
MENHHHLITTDDMFGGLIYACVACKYLAIVSPSNGDTTVIHLGDITVDHDALREYDLPPVLVAQITLIVEEAWESWTKQN